MCNNKYTASIPDSLGDLYYTLHATQSSITLVHRHLSEAALPLGAGQADTAQNEIDKIIHCTGGCIWNNWHGLVAVSENGSVPWSTLWIISFVERPGGLRFPLPNPIRAWGRGSYFAIEGLQGFTVCGLLCLYVFISEGVVF